MSIASRERPSAIRQRQSSERVAALDALRGLAAGIVVFHHAFSLNPNLADKLRGASEISYNIAVAISDQNKNAVLFFFVLSGYVIALATQQGTLTLRTEVREYAWRRFLRIVPLYWFSLLWTFAFGAAIGWRDPSYSALDLFGNLAFLQSSVASHSPWFAPFGLNGPYWSLSCEVIYYLLLPVCAAAAAGGLAGLARSAALWTLLSLAIAFGAIALGRWTGGPFVTALSLYPVWVVGFVLGRRELGAWRLLIALAAASAAVLCLEAIEQVGLHSDTLRLLRNGLMIALFFGAAVAAAQRLDSPAIRTLEQSFLVLFGRIGKGSYALYLLHYPVFLALAAWLPSISNDDSISTALVLGAAAILALGFCPWLEGHSIAAAQSLRRRLARKETFSRGGERLQEAAER